MNQQCQEARRDEVVNGLPYLAVLDPDLLRLEGVHQFPCRIA
jgi:hypothetical protein